MNNQNPTELEEYLDSVEEYKESCFAMYREMRNRALETILEQEKFRERKKLEDMTVSEIKNLIEIEKMILNIMNQTMDMGAKALGVEVVLEELNKRASK